jgi:alkanesulfonate monooxygenase SsuD/methylene tetrahydromethanopterin reductase-like flavin-dependent oxidoreductase (luciferase family)
MRHGIVLFTCDRGITPARAAKAAEDRGFASFYVPEHTRSSGRAEARRRSPGSRGTPTAG